MPIKKKLSSSFDLRSFFAYHFDVFSIFYSSLIETYLKSKYYIDVFLTEEEKKMKERKASKKPNEYMARVYPSSFDGSWLVIVDEIEQPFFF